MRDLAGKDSHDNGSGYELWRHLIMRTCVEAKKSIVMRLFVIYVFPEVSILPSFEYSSGC